MVLLEVISQHYHTISAMRIMRDWGSMTKTKQEFTPPPASPGFLHESEDGVGH